MVRGSLGSLTRVITPPGLILAKNNDGPLKWANGPYPIQIHANFQISNGRFEIFMCPLQNLMGPRILNIHIRA